METFKVSQHLVAISASLLVILVLSVDGQIGTPCTTSTVSSFTPCINYITGSTANGSAPTSDCCDTLKTIMSTSSDCACLLLTANVPFQIPINPNLAISLPQACKMSGVPLQCKASGSPLPTPGPVVLGPTLPPKASASRPRGPVVLGPTLPPKASAFSPRVSKASRLAPAPDSETTLQPTAASPPVGSKVPTATPGIRPVLTPSTSASDPSYISSPPLLLIVVGILVLKCY